ncbi:MAG: hotdog family protein [Methylohalobius crimeensis]
MNYDPRRFPLASLLPQSGDMLLLDRLLEVTDEAATAALTVRDDHLFSLPVGSVPAWVGLEYMAQAVAAWSGYHCRRRGEPIRPGLLLGTRRFDLETAGFACGSTLTVRGERVFEAANDMCVFDCLIEDSKPVARARLNVLLPPDLKPFLRGEMTS